MGLHSQRARGRQCRPGTSTGGTDRSRRDAAEGESGWEAGQAAWERALLQPDMPGHSRSSIGVIGAAAVPKSKKRPIDDSSLIDQRGGACVCSLPSCSRSEKKSHHWPLSARAARASSTAVRVGPRWRAHGRGRAASRCDARPSSRARERYPGAAISDDDVARAEEVVDLARPRAVARNPNRGTSLTEWHRHRGGRPRGGPGRAATGPAAPSGSGRS